VVQHVLYKSLASGRAAYRARLNHPAFALPLSDFARAAWRQATNRNCSMTKVVRTAVLLAAMCLPASAYCQSVGHAEITAEEQRACGPDVVRLCGDMLPDVSRVLGCMKSKRSQVSPACTKVARARGL
jgi:hypothetical protein